MTAQADPIALPVEANAIVKEIVALGITHVVTVPDSVQRALLLQLEEEPSLAVHTVCTEDEAIGITAGLYAGGMRPMMSIQNNGFFACINTIKAIALDAKVPTFMLVGQFGRDVTKPVEESRNRAVHRLEPTMDAWSVPHYRLEGPDDIGNVRAAYDRATNDLGPCALIIGAPTR